MAQPQHAEIHMVEEDTQTQLAEQAVNRNRTDRVVSVLGRMGLGLVLGAAGGYPLGTSMSATEEAMESLMKNTLITNKTELAEMQDMPVLLKLVGFQTGIILGLASSVIGIAFGKAAASAVMRMKGPESGAKALAAAGPVALLGVTATGAAQGAVTEKIASAIGAAGLLVGLTGFIVVMVAFYEFSLRLFRTRVNERCWFRFPVINIAFFALLMGAWVAGFGWVALTLCSVIYLLLVALFLPGALWLLIMHPCLLLLPPCSGGPTVAVMFITYPLQAIGISGLNTIYFGVGAKETVMSVATCNIAIGMVVIAWMGCRGVGKISLGAAAAGQAVLTVIQNVASMLGTGGTAGALLGPMGAAGVSVAAALVATSQYGRAGGAGVAMGAAGGIYLGIGGPNKTFWSLVTALASCFFDVYSVMFACFFLSCHYERRSKQSVF